MTLIFYGSLLSLLSGLAITAGAGLARIEFCKRSWLKEEIKHGIIAFGGGALFSAIALVLIPDGTKHQPAYSVLLTFFCGGATFMFIDMALQKSGTRLSQFLAMMLDFVPEAIVLGAFITQNFSQAVFLSIVIAAQNLPEGYAAYTEIDNGKNKKFLLLMFLLAGLTGPLYVMLGVYVFVDHPMILGMMMTFCAGGILYLIFEDIAPRAVMEKHWLPPFGTVLGFMVGLTGYLFV